MKFPWVSRAVYDQAVTDKRIAEDRLYAAWKDGYTIPPRQSVVDKVPEPIRVLPEKLHAFVTNWESEETRKELEGEARRLHYDLGMTEERVLELFMARNGDGHG